MTSNQLKVYHSQWGIYARKFWADEIPDYLGVIYSFWDVASDKISRHPLVRNDVKNTITTRDYYGDREAAKGGWGTKTTQWDMMRAKTAKGIATQLSIGGWTFSHYFSDACLTPESRAIFVGAIIETFKENSGVFKGVALDWEYPSDKGESIGYGDNITRVGDGDRLILTCKLLREQLNANGMSEFTISGFISGDPGKLEGHLKVKELSEWMDELHVQGYDLADGNWGETIASHQCNLYPKAGITRFSCHESIQYFLSKGVPSKQIHIGIATYSRGYTCDGFGKAATDGANKWSSWERGILDYRHIMEGGKGEFGDIPKFPVEPTWDDDMKAHYWYDPVSRQLVSSDTPRSVEEKAKYAYKWKLGGMFIWDSGGDVRDHNKSTSIFKAVKDFWIDPISAPPPPVVVPPPPPPVIVPPPPPPVVVPPPPPPVVVPPSSDLWKFLLLGLLIGAAIVKLSED